LRAKVISHKQFVGKHINEFTGQDVSYTEKRLVPNQNYNK